MAKDAIFEHSAGKRDHGARCPDVKLNADKSYLLCKGSDGAYDGEPVSQAVLDKQPDAQVIIPPHKTAVLSAAGDSQRDQHIRDIERHGRIAWQQKRTYGLRNYVELAMQRNTLKARKLPQQKTEAWISAAALNRMTSLGMPLSVKI